jgi:two-component system CheB/CheR fusion protein
MAAKKEIKTEPSATVQNFPVVGIGASAGGLDAFKRLLTVIPESSGMAYVLVQHLDPSHESFLPEILQRVTKIPVFEITEDIHLAPDNIYIIPANKILISTDGVLQLSPRNKKTINYSIDIFFTSLAEVHKEFAVGVVLSGTGSDGTQGLKAIKEHGGTSIVQDKESAAYDSMPQSAIQAGVVDFILAPEKIPAQLLQINSAFKTSQDYKVEKQLAKDDDDIFKQIILLLRQRSGVDFAYYKQQTLRRRIARRSAIVKKKNITRYLEFLSSNTAEQDALFQDVLIPVTSFFRDPTTFQALTETVFPSFLKNNNDDAPIRIWIAGCSTGEEAYSIAICLDEFLGEKVHNKKIQIFASDISEKAIKKARAGIYTKADVEILSASRLENYFTKNGDGYEVSKHIRDMCVIAPHNFLKDPPFAKMDLISCRNVLIYMDTFLQKKAFANFHYALKETGFLLLGKSETVGVSSDLFTQVEKNEKIYSRKPTPGRFTHVTTERKEERMTTKGKAVTKMEVKQTDFRKSAEAIMIFRSPASVIVNEQLDIVHIHGDITPFLQVPQGKPTHNLVKMAREGLGFELRNAIHKASKEQIAITKLDIPVKTNATMNGEVGQEQQSLVAIEIIPLTDTVERHYLIRFEKTVIPAHQEEKLSLSGKTKKDLPEKRNEQLEKELAHIREDMRSIAEDMDASNEELQSANEELQSSNEEMQSLNEELETSKEELQSTNEELIIVNQELLDKQEQFNNARYYAESIVTTIREPLIVLDKKLCIKTANASFYKKFNTEEQDTEGKLFYEIQNHQWDDNLMRSLLEKILPERERLTDFEISLNFPSIGKRTLLLNAVQIINKKKSEKLILLAIEDITERKLAEQKLKTFAEELETQVKERTAALHKSNQELKQSNSQLDQFAYVASHDLQEPLRKILTFSARLQDKHQDEMGTEVKYYLNKIQAASSRMRTLIQDLLNYSRLLQHEKLFSTTDLNETVRNILSDFELLIQEKKAKITIDHLPFVDAIPLQMNQLFYNLLSNALKFSKVDVPPDINIISRTLSEKEVEKYPSFNPSIPYVEIIFKDNGIGFEQQYAKQIFTIFQRLHDKETYIGTGIGLALCKKIIENHHGEIFSNSKENEGAFFHVILPLIQPQ